MLVVTQRFRTILGFITGCGAIVLGTIAFDGVQIWLVFLRFLTGFGRLARGSNGQFSFNRWQYLDLNAFSFGIPGGRSTFGLSLIVLFGAAIAVLLVRAWRKSALQNRPEQMLVWATVLTWTLVLNVYAPIYDSISLIIGIALTIGALQELHWEFSVEWVVILGAVTFFVSVFTTGYAKVHGVQLMTIDLVLLGVVQLVLLRSATTSSQRRAADGSSQSQRDLSGRLAETQSGAV
jgi:hypothetical protein